MRTGLLAIMLPLVLCTGCAKMYKQRVNQQLWERELRLQEDCIYKLRWQLEDTQRLLADANQRLGTSTKENDILRDAVPDAGPALSSPGILDRGRGSEAPRLPAAPGTPSIQQGQEFIPGGSPTNTPPPKGSGSSGRPMELRGPAVSPASANMPIDSKDLSGNPLRPSEKMNPDAEVERIILNPNHTGGLNSDATPGDDMLSIAIEQRSTQDERILAPGDLSIVLVDPALEGKAAKLARWDFDSDEVARHVRRNREGASFQFELPWQTQPTHSDLRLFVRFTTYDGRRLEANLPIEVDLESRESKPSGWKTSPKRQAAEEAKTVAVESEPTEKRSVYQASDEPREADTTDDSPREAKRTRPSWSPSR